MGLEAGRTLFSGRSGKPRFRRQEMRVFEAIDEMERGEPEIILLNQMQSGRKFIRSAKAERCRR
jgi:hypothetical protein